jgi:molybdopterin/thiamine biosynthesis adenylyltransferase
MESYLYERNKPNIIIIGAGGTGGNLVYNLWRERKILANMINSIVLYDRDTVESKNLLRQNFDESDVGKNKAEVLAERYSGELTIRAVPDFFNAKEYVDEVNVFDSITGNDIVISCVDNLVSRVDIMEELLSIHEELGTSEVPLFVDTGNEQFHGHNMYLFTKEILSQYLDYTKARVEEDDAPYNKSCADLEEHDDGFIQIYSVNMFAALYASQFIMKVLDKEANFELMSQMHNHGLMFTMSSTKQIMMEELIRNQEEANG